MEGLAGQWLQLHFRRKRRISPHAVVRSITDEVNRFLNWPNSSSHTMALGSTLTKMSTRYLPVGKVRPEREADNLTAICEPIVWKMWELRHLTTLWAFTACYRDSFTFFLPYPCNYDSCYNPHTPYNLFSGLDQILCSFCWERPGLKPLTVHTYILRGCVSHVTLEWDRESQCNVEMYAYLRIEQCGFVTLCVMLLW
jgi:hypothetical protein